MMFHYPLKNTHHGEVPETVQEISTWEDFINQYPHLRPMVEQYLEEATTGNPAYEMFYIVRHCGTSREWAEREILRVKAGNPAEAIYHMVRDCGSPREWAEREIPKVKVGDPTWAMFLWFFTVDLLESGQSWRFQK